jgi:hypothetical protein
MRRLGSEAVEPHHGMIPHRQSISLILLFKFWNHVLVNHPQVI